MHLSSLSQPPNELTTAMTISPLWASPLWAPRIPLPFLLFYRLARKQITCQIKYVNTQTPTCNILLYSSVGKLTPSSTWVEGTRSLVRKEQESQFTTPPLQGSWVLKIFDYGLGFRPRIMLK